MRPSHGWAAWEKKKCVWLHAAHFLPSGGAAVALNVINVQVCPSIAVAAAALLWHQDPRSLKHCNRRAPGTGITSGNMRHGPSPSPPPGNGKSAPLLRRKPVQRGPVITIMLTMFVVERHVCRFLGGTPPGVWGAVSTAELSSLVDLFNTAGAGGSSWTAGAKANWQVGDPCTAPWAGVGCTGGTTVR